MNTIKRTVALLIAVVMLLSNFTFFANAATMSYTPSAQYQSSKYYTALQNVVLTGDGATDLLNIALSQVGYHEGSSLSDLNGANTASSSNYTEYGYWYGHHILNKNNGHFYAWCAMFISWCARQAGISAGVISNAAYASASGNSHTFKNLTYTQRKNASPTPGDLIFFGDEEHVGIVYKVDASTVTTIEGNADDCVRIKSYNISDTYIAGYGRPNYEQKYLSGSGMSIDAFNSILQTFKDTVYGHGVKYQNNDSGSLGYQCFGYANYLARYIFGNFPAADESGVGVRSGWTITHGGAAVDNLQPGDVVRYWGHSIFITQISGNDVYYTDCNSDGNDTRIVKWNQHVSKSTLKSKVSDNLKNPSSITGKYYTGWVAHYNNGVNGGSPSTPSYNKNTNYPTPFQAYTKSGETYEVYSSVNGSKTGGWIAKNDICTIEEVYTNGWLKVTYPVSNGTRTVYSPTSVFFDSYSNIRTETVVADTTVYRRSDLSETRGNADKGDVCTIIGSSGSYYCVVCPWGTASVASSGKLMVWISKDAFKHVHDYSYSTGSYEKDHPHRVYNTCSCGEWKYTGETKYLSSCTTCNPPHVHYSSYKTNHEAAHPHRVYMTCSCGATTYTGETKNLSSCTECTLPELPTITISKTAWSENETITFSWQACKNADYYFPMVYDSNKNRVAVCWGTTAKSYEVNLAAGTYYIQVASVNNSTGQTNYCAQKEITVSKKNYTIKFDGNGGTWSNGNLTKRHNVDIVVPDVWPERTGYTFKGWSKTKNGSIYCYATSKITENASFTLYAVWQANTYTIKYNANGGTGTMSNSSHTYDVAKNLSTNAFTKTGYTFTGWATSASGNVKYSDKQSIKNLSSKNNATVTLYAIWQPITYTIKYNANGGTGTMSNSSHTYDVAKNLSTNAFTRNGYTFKGWARTSTATEIKYNDKHSVRNLTTTNGATVTLYAMWEIKTVSVTGVTLGNTSATLTVGDTLTLNATVAPSNATNKNITWSSSNTSVASVSNGVVTAKAAGNATITVTTADGGKTASCSVTVKAKTYTITYDANGGTGAPASQTKTHDVPLTLSSTIPVRTGYQFRGWAITKNGNSVFPIGATYSENVGRTLYAVWEEEKQETCEIEIWVVNDESTDKVILTKNKGDIINLGQYKPKKTGYTFIAWVDWYTEEYYSADDMYVVLRDALIISGMQANSYIVYYDANGGNVSENLKSVKFDSTYGELATPTRSGYKFNGWYTEQEGGEKITSDMIVKTPENHTVYAHWSEDIQIIQPTGVTLNKTSATLTVGDTLTLNATVTPSNATNKNLTWSSSNTSVASVSNGVVTAKSAGNATITVTTADGGKTASCNVTVKAKAPVEIPENAPVIKVEEIKATAGKTVSVKVDIANNPGVIAMALWVDYDSNVMTLEGATDGGILGTQMHSPDYTKNPYTIAWNNGTATSDFTANGTIVTLNFKIKEGVAVGTYPITLSYSSANFDIINKNFDAVDFVTVAGGVEIIDFVYGDVDGDGIVTNKDSAIVARYLARWTGYEATNAAYNFNGADVDGDGVVTNKDSAIIARYLARWTGYEALPKK